MFPSLWREAARPRVTAWNLIFVHTLGMTLIFFINAASFLLGKNGDSSTEGGQKDYKFIFSGRQE